MRDGGFHLLIQQLDIKVLWLIGEETTERSFLQDCPGLSVTTVHSLPEAATFLEADDFDAILATLPFTDGRIETLLGRLPAQTNRRFRRTRDRRHDPQHVRGGDEEADP